MTEVGVMDVMDRVANVLLGSRGNTYCSSCLAASLAVATEYEVQRVVTALSDSASFQRNVQSMLVVRPRQDRDLLK